MTKTDEVIRANELLVFSKGNAKVGKDTLVFNLPAGYSCPGAKACFAYANKETGKVTDGPKAQFRCFAAMDEARYPSARKSRWHNFELLQGLSEEQMIELLWKSLPTTKPYVRIHSSGDFFSEAYFRAWCAVAARVPKITFYAYTKMANYWIENEESIPENLELTASLGGQYDHLVRDFGLKSAQVVFSEAEAKGRGLEIDHDDSCARRPGRNFALLLHGSQRAGSTAAKAVVAIRKNGFTGYGKQHNTRKEVHK